MAVRIRKLARELGRSPVELLGVLHALGLQRYRSPEDMLPSSVEAKLRRGLKRGIQPVSVNVSTQPASRRPTVESVASSGKSEQQDFMARLVPGVVPVGGRGGQRDGGPRMATSVPSKASALPSAPPEDRRPATGAVSSPVVEAPHPSAPLGHTLDGDARILRAERDALESSRRRLMSEKAVFESEKAGLEDEIRRLRAQQRGLDAERDALVALRAALEEERLALSAERDALSSASARLQTAELVGLQDLLEARGLRGADEFERALVALAKGRHLRDVLWTIRLDPAEKMSDLLDDRLMLTSGPPPAALGRGMATVEVAPDRAEVESGAVIEKRLSSLGEHLMLNGLRRMLIVGGKPTWQRIIASGLDRRLEVRTAPPATRTAHLAEADVVRTDIVALWGVEVSPAAREIYGSCRAMVVEVDDPSLAGFFKATMQALAD